MMVVGAGMRSDVSGWTALRRRNWLWHASDLVTLDLAGAAAEIGEGDEGNSRGTL